MIESEWVCCPVCGSKTRDRIREDTVLENYPLYCLLSAGALSIVCGVITIIAVLSLVVIASYIELPTIARIALIVFAIATAVVGMEAAAMLEVKAGYYECPHCKALFVPTMGEYVKGYHTLTKRRLTCHECDKVGMCKHRIIR